MAQKTKKTKSAKRSERDLPSKKKNKAGKKAVKTGKKRRVKKRFFLFCIILILLLAAGGYFGIKAFTGSGGEKNSQTNQKEETEDSNTSGSAITTESAITQGAVSTANGQTGQIPEDSYEASVYNAVLNSYYISPIGQTKAVVTEFFGDITHYEDWNGGLFFHREFPETMYVQYAGVTEGQDMPPDMSICCTVEVALEKIMQVEEAFTPASWGSVSVNKDHPGVEWTDYSYTIPFGTGAYTMTVFCDEEGVVQPDTHVKVKMV